MLLTVENGPHLLMEIRVIRMLLTVENGPHLLMEIRVIRMLLTVENGPHLLMEIRVIRMLTHSGEWTTSAHGDQSGPFSTVSSILITLISRAGCYSQWRMDTFCSWSDQDATHLLMEIRVIRMLLTVENGPHGHLMLMEMDQSDQDATHSGEWTTSAHGDQSDQDATHSGEWILITLISMEMWSILHCESGCYSQWRMDHICSWRSE